MPSIFTINKGITLKKVAMKKQSASLQSTNTIQPIIDIIDLTNDDEPLRLNNHENQVHMIEQEPSAIEIITPNKSIEIIDLTED
jgi:hypothetical protein